MDAQNIIRIDSNPVLLARLNRLGTHPVQSVSADIVKWMACRKFRHSSSSFSFSTTVESICSCAIMYLQLLARDERHRVVVSSDSDEKLVRNRIAPASVCIHVHTLFTRLNKTTAIQSNIINTIDIGIQCAPTVARLHFVPEWIKHLYWRSS